MEPEKRNKVYEARSANAGASPESAQVTVNAVPPGIEAPAAGIVNLTSANAQGMEAARRKRELEGRIVVVRGLSAKRVA